MIELTNKSAGTKLPAGLSYATVLPDIDFETFSYAGYCWDEPSRKFRPPIHSTKRGLPAIGLQRYAEDETTEILSLAYDLKDGIGARIWIPGEEDPHDLFYHIHRGGLIEAWNVSFEYVVWNYVACRWYGWPELKIANVRCAAAKSRAFALPGSLDAAGNVLNIKNKKDKDGKRLLTKFSMPRNPTKSDYRLRIMIQDDRLDALNLYKYNLQDIAAESELSEQTPDLNEFEQKFWAIDFEINRRGVRIDVPVMQASLVILEQAQNKYNGELATITNGAVKSATEVSKLRQYLQSIGVTVDSLDSEHIEQLLAQPLPPKAWRALKIRELIGGSAIKKLYAMHTLLARDERIHDMFIYHTARTGRHGGSGLQPQNFPNSGLSTRFCECGKYNVRDVCTWCGATVPDTSVEWNPVVMEQAIDVIKSGSFELVEYVYGDALGTISSCLRGMLIPSDGHDFICSDYSAIEAVVLACLAGETWREDVFRDHGKIYEMSASKIFGIAFEEFERHKQETGQHHPARKKGKVAELASGYGGGLGAWKKFKADAFMTDDQIKTAVQAWRFASPAIVAFWGGQRERSPRGWVDCYHGLEGMAIAAVRDPGTPYAYRSITYLAKDDVLYCTLPSGRHLTYHRPRVEPAVEAWKGLQLSFEGWNNNPAKGGTNQWLRMYTYGGSLCENVVQAVARDILANAIVSLERAGYKIVLHVHDEIVAEVPEGMGSVEEFESIMSTMPAWATGWPIRASGGWRGKRYTK